MNKYLEKIAKEYFEEVRVEDTDNGRKVGAAIAGMATASVLQQKVVPLLTKPVVAATTQWDPSISRKDLASIMSEGSAKHNVTFDLRDIGGNPEFRNQYSDFADSVGPHYLDRRSMPTLQKQLHFFGKAKDKATGLLDKLFNTGHITYNNELKEVIPFSKSYIHAPALKNSDVVIHELGHAADFNQGASNLKHALSHPSKILSKVSPLIGGAMLSNDNTRDYAWTVPLVTAAPTLREEFAANHEGYKMLKAKGLPTNKFLRLAGTNMLGYLAPPAVAAATLAGINYARKTGENINVNEYLRDE